MKNTIGSKAAVLLGRLPGKKRLLLAGGAVCLAAWLAFVAGLVMGAGNSAQLILLTVALVVTEGLFWLAAAMFGSTVVQLRRKLLGKLLPGGRRDAA